MVTDLDPPPLPRPDADGSPALAERLRAAWAHRVPDTGAFTAPVAVFVVVAVAGIFVWSRLATGPAAPLEVALPTLDPATIATTAPASALDAALPVIVHVAGAVERPGLYEMTDRERVGDAVERAGGAAADADLDRINLAALLIDGAQINVPRIGQPLSTVADSLGPDTSAPGPVDINTAGVEELETLPGVGPATAAAIVAHRDEHGPFTSVAALDDVTGIGPARLDALRDLVVAGGAAPAAASGAAGP